MEIAAALVAVVLSAPALAEECRKACYPDEVRDSTGCCVPKQTGATKPNEPPSPAGCPYGLETSNDTQGHCCWPGQAWNGSACVGAPTRCPPDFSVPPGEQRCAPPACLDGRVRMGDDVHCCWPSQAWSTERRRCVGIPSCPAATHAQSGEECVDQRPRLQAEEEARRRADAERRAREHEAAVAAENARRAAEDAQRAAEGMRLAAHEETRAAARSRRIGGVVLWCLGAVGFGVSGGLAGLSAANNSKIRAGGFADADDIRTAEKSGFSANTGAYAALVLGGIAVTIGTLLFLLSPDPGPAPPP